MPNEENDKSFADYFTEVVKYASKLKASELVLLGAVGVVIGIRSIASAFDQSKQKYTHTHFVDKSGNFIWSNEMWVNDQHACDGKYLKVIVDVPENEEVSWFKSALRSVHNGGIKGLGA